MRQSVRGPHIGETRLPHLFTRGCHTNHALGSRNNQAAMNYLLAHLEFY